MEMASLSARCRTSSRIDHFPGPGRAVRSSRVSPATASRRRGPHATYSSITCLSIGISWCPGGRGERAANLPLVCGNDSGRRPKVHASRGDAAAGLTALLGEVIEGIVGSDRWSAYHNVALNRWQVCWAHLVRDFTAMVD